jgi:hypothetical protein
MCFPSFLSKVYPTFIWLHQGYQAQRVSEPLPYGVDFCAVARLLMRPEYVGSAERCGTLHATRFGVTDNHGAVLLSGLHVSAASGEGDWKCRTPGWNKSHQN